MSLQDMINRVTPVTESVKIGPHNSDFPIYVWFERDRKTKHHGRIKIQNRAGYTNSNEFIPIDPMDLSIRGNKNGNIKIKLPSKLYKSMINFLRDNSDLTDKYYGINRLTGRSNGDTISESEFTDLIIERSHEYFS